MSPEGYKEFHDYLSALDSSEGAFRVAVERMKLGTRRYAKRQVAWIRNKLLPVVSAANTQNQAENEEPIVPTYLLDATGLWIHTGVTVYGHVILTKILDMQNWETHGKPMSVTRATTSSEVGVYDSPDFWTSQHRVIAAFLEGEALPDPLTLSPAASEMLVIRDRPTECVVLSELCHYGPLSPLPAAR